MGIFDDLKESLENFFEDVTKKYNLSKQWKEYLLGFRKTHCYVCAKRLYKVYDVSSLEYLSLGLPEHSNCGCHLDWLRSIDVGQATKLGVNGADFYLKYFQKLPNYYITKQYAYGLGWKPWLGNLDKIAPNKMIGGSIYLDRSEKLPKKSGRIWYECDINYNGGYRNNSRLVYSNDGLIFKTDDHYQRFIAVE